MLRPVIALQDQPGMPEAIAQIVTASADHVCSVCGLQRTGHAPESAWLGFAVHPWTPILATVGMIDNARNLTAQAYRQRP